jgi:hypothetical protein
MSALDDDHFQRISENGLFRRLYALLTWKDPLESGLVLTAVSLTYYLMEFQGYTMPMLICIILLSLQLLCHLYVAIYRWLHSRKSKAADSNVNPLVERFKGREARFESSHFAELAELLALLCSLAARHLRRALYLDHVFAIKFAFYTLLIALLQSMASSLTLCYLGTPAY